MTVDATLQKEEQAVLTVLSLFCVRTGEPHIVEFRSHEMAMKLLGEGALKSELHSIAAYLGQGIRDLGEKGVLGIIEFRPGVLVLDISRIQAFFDHLLDSPPSMESVRDRTTMKPINDEFLFPMPADEGLPN
jgi:hypothetical protein